MSGIFIKLLNMSIAAGWLVLCVVFLRLLLKKAPRWIFCILWAMVALRLLCPFSIESALSLIPSAETVPEEIIYSESPEIHTGIEYFNSTVNPIISEELAPTPENRINPVEIITRAASVLWVAGMAAMALYALVSYIRIRKRVSEAAEAEKGVWICDGADSPFILGLFRPRIILPSDMGESEREYVIAHERAHISRMDYIWKPLGFLLLTVYWFNPVIWIAYILLCRDIEAACDEKVIKKLGEGAKKPYAEALISCSVQRRTISACPLAFGETGVKGRVKSVLNYKKPAFWIIIVSLILCVGAGVFFLTDPKKDGIKNIANQKSESYVEGVSVTITDCELSAPDPYITVEWKNETEDTVVFGEEFYIYRYEDGKWEDTRLDSDPMWNLIGYYVNPKKTTEKKYSLNGLIMTQEGKYRFETTFHLDGKDYVPCRASVEFELEKGVEGITVHILDPKELVYVNSVLTYSYIQDADSAPEYRIVNDMELISVSGGETRLLGRLSETELTEKSFTAKFSESEYGWSDKAEKKNVEKLLLKNKRAWELFADDGYFYTVFLQKDGSYYIGMGAYGEVKPHYRWIYRAEQKSGTASGNNTATEELGNDKNVEIYMYPDSPEALFSPQISLSKEDSTFRFSYSLLSSALIMGRYERKGDELILTTDAEEPEVYVFRVIDENTLAFVSEKSARIPSYRYAEGEEEQCPVPDGAEFRKVGTGGNFSASVIPEIDAIEHDINGDGYPESCTMSDGPTSGIMSIRLHIVDGKDQTEYETWFGIDYNVPSFWLDENDALCISGERMIKHHDNYTELEICIFDVSLEGEEIKVTEREAAKSGGFIRVSDVYEGIRYDDSVSDDEKKRVSEKMHAIFGMTDADTGYETSYIIAGTLEIGKEQFYLVYLQWLVENEEGMPHHASCVSSYVISRDLSRLYEAYFENDGVLKVYNGKNIIN